MGGRFWALWAANSFSGLGDGFSAVALPLLAATLTHRPLLIAAVLFAERLPWLVVGLPAGAYADRADRARLMRQMDGLRAGVLIVATVLVATRHLSIGLLYLFALIIGTCDPFFTAANQATVSAIVPKARLAQANGLLEVGQNTTAQTVGPALGGVAFSVARAVPFALDAVSFVGSALFLLGLGRTSHQGPARRSGLAANLRGLRAETGAGLTWYRHSRALVVITATVAVLAFSQAMVSAILVLFAIERLHLSGAGYGLFIGVAAIGNVIGGVVAGPILRRATTAPVLLAAVVLSAVGYLATSATSSPVLAATFLGLGAVAVVVGSVATITYRQRAAPAELQARVATVWRTVIWGAIPLGALAGGGVAVVAGLRAPLVLAGGVQLALVVIVARPLLRLLPQMAD